MKHLGLEPLRKTGYHCVEGDKAKVKMANYRDGDPCNKAKIFCTRFCTDTGFPQRFTTDVVYDATADLLVVDEYTELVVLIPKISKTESEDTFFEAINIFMYLQKQKDNTLEYFPSILRVDQVTEFVNKAFLDRCWDAGIQVEIVQKHDH